MEGKRLVCLSLMTRKRNGEKLWAAEWTRTSSIIKTWMYDVSKTGFYEYHFFQENKSFKSE